MPDSAMASRHILSCLSLFTLLSTTPRTRASSRNRENPRAVAASDLAVPDASSTSTTLQPSSEATWYVLARSPRPEAPS